MIGAPAQWLKLLLNAALHCCQANATVHVCVQMLNLDLHRYDGISLRVKGDGQTFKFNLKTADQMNVPESTYQAQFDTVNGEWTTVYMPWHAFVPVTRAQYDAKAKPLDPAQVKQVGLVLSRFHYNSLPNQRHKPGKFELQVSCLRCGGASLPLCWCSHRAC